LRQTFPRTASWRPSNTGRSDADGGPARGREWAALAPSRSVGPSREQRSLVERDRRTLKDRRPASITTAEDRSCWRLQRGIGPCTGASRNWIRAMRGQICRWLVETRAIGSPPSAS
jgi:hypothetical protein